MTSRNPYLQAGLFLGLLFTAVAFMFGARNHRNSHQEYKHHQPHDQHRSHYGAGHAKSLVYTPATSVSVGLPMPANDRDFEIPTWPGCKQKNYEDRLDCTREKYLAFLKGHLRAPEGRKGRVACIFNVELNGQMTDAELYEETDPFLSAEVMRLVGMMQGADLRWTPGKVKNKERVLKMGLVVSFGQRCRDCAEVDFELVRMD